jgi:hypothetical protein
VFNTLSVFVWNDKDGNTNFNGDENSLVGWTVIISANGQEQRQNTNAVGRATFPDLTVDTEYTISVVPANAGWEATTGNPQTWTGGSCNEHKFGFKQIQPILLPTTGGGGAYLISTVEIKTGESIYTTWVSLGQPGDWQQFKTAFAGENGITNPNVVQPGIYTIPAQYVG